jgi:hypothetical protein
VTARVSGAEVPWDSELDPPPIGQWVIGLWYGEESPIPESGTVRLMEDGIWYDELGEAVGAIDPTHWIPLPKLETP